jgi:hypothetical protein
MTYQVILETTQGAVVTTFEPRFAESMLAYISQLIAEGKTFRVSPDSV